MGSRRRYQRQGMCAWSGIGDEEEHTDRAVQGKRKRLLTPPLLEGEQETAHEETPILHSAHQHLVLVIAAVAQSPTEPFQGQHTHESSALASDKQTSSSQSQVGGMTVVLISMECCGQQQEHSRCKSFLHGFCWCMCLTLQLELPKAPSLTHDTPIAGNTLWDTTGCRAHRHK